MKKLVAIVLVMSSFLFCANSFAADEKEKPSILGKTMDESLAPFKEVFTPSTRLDPLVITPSRYSEPSLNVPGNVTVIDSERIQKSNARTVPELFKQEVGIEVRDLLGNGKTSQVDIRGFGEACVSNVLVLVDGRRTNQIDISGTDWLQIDLDSIERIEISRGSGTVLYGDNATAGVINIITKFGAGTPKTIFKAKYGNYHYYSYSGNFSGGNDFLDYFVSFSNFKTNGYRKNNDLLSTDVNGNFNIKPNDFLNIKLLGGYHKDFYGQPGSLSVTKLAELGRRGATYLYDRAKTEDWFTTISPDIKISSNIGNADLSTDVIYRSRRSTSSAYDRTMLTTSHIKSFGVLPKIAFTTDIFNIANRFITGFDYYKHTDEILSGYPGSEDVINIKKESIGAYATDTINITEPLSLDFGGRTEWTKYTFDQQAVAIAFNKKTPIEYAYDVGLNYKYNNRSSIYAKYDRSFRFPAVDEWYNALWEYGALKGGGLNLALKPQTAHDYEVGIKENSSKYIGARAAYFLSDIRHELFLDPDPAPGLNQVYPHTIHQGLELETHAYLVESLDAFFKYTYTKAYFVGEKYAGNQLPLVSRDKFSTGVDYTFKDCVNINVVVNYVGPRYMSNDQRNVMPKLKAHTTVDGRISYKKNYFEIFFACNNIFGKKYFDTAITNAAGSSTNYYPAPESSFFAGVTYGF